MAYRPGSDEYPRRPTEGPAHLPKGKNWFALRFVSFSLMRIYPGSMNGGRQGSLPNERIWYHVVPAALLAIWWWLRLLWVPVRWCGHCYQPISNPRWWPIAKVSRARSRVAYDNALAHHLHSAKAFLHLLEILNHIAHALAALSMDAVENFKGGRSSMVWRSLPWPGTTRSMIPWGVTFSQKPSKCTKHPSNQLTTGTDQEFPKRVLRASSRHTLPCSAFFMHCLVYPLGKPKMTSRSCTLGGRLPWKLGCCHLCIDTEGIGEDLPASVELHEPARYSVRLACALVPDSGEMLRRLGEYDLVSSPIQARGSPEDSPELTT